MTMGIARRMALHNGHRCTEGGVRITTVSAIQVTVLVVLPRRSA